MSGAVGILHPGLMGETLAANCGARTFWLSHGRSNDTRSRAQAQGMVEVDALLELCEQVDTVISICPPSAALGQGAQVAAAGFEGLYVDANAVSPETARLIGDHFEHFVDGSVIGPPAHRAGTTRLYLSGARAGEVADLYADSALDARVIGDQAGQASALKMAYASWTKIGAAMQLGIRAMARAEGVEAALINEWGISQPGLAERTERAAAGVAPKAWRFTGEMEQIAASFAAADLPSGFAEAANEIYARLADFKGLSPDLDQVLTELLPSTD